MLEDQPQHLAMTKQDNPQCGSSHLFPAVNESLLLWRDPLLLLYPLFNSLHLDRHKHETMKHDAELYQDCCLVQSFIS